MDSRVGNEVDLSRGPVPFLLHRAREIANTLKLVGCLFYFALLDRGYMKGDRSASFNGGATRCFLIR